MRDVGNNRVKWLRGGFKKWNSHRQLKKLIQETYSPMLFSGRGREVRALSQETVNLTLAYLARCLHAEFAWQEDLRKVHEHSRRLGEPYSSVADRLLGESERAVKVGKTAFWHFHGLAKASGGSYGNYRRCGFHVKASWSDYLPDKKSE